MNYKLHFVLALIISSASNATTQDRLCFNDASKRYNVNIKLLQAHAIKESSLNPKAINRVGDCEAVGIMQIHCQWFPKLKEKYNVTRDMLLDDPCLNINVGAWIIASNFAERGVSWDTVGGYYAGFTSANESHRRWYYSGKGGIKEIYERLKHGEDPIVIAKGRK